jgi:FkbM family methyltransferase
MNYLFQTLVCPAFNNLFRYWPNFYSKVYFIYKNIAERENIRIIQHYIKPGDVVVDVGANIGFYTRIFSRLVGAKGQVHVFEPDIENYKLLKTNCRNCTNVKFNCLAVGPKTGKTWLYLSNSLNVDHQTYDSHEARPRIQIPMISLDKYLEKNTRINFLKVDIQGFDYFALAGARRILKISKRCTIIGEYWPYGISKTGIKPEKYLHLFKSLGFRIELLGPIPNYNKYSYINILATKP